MVLCDQKTPTRGFLRVHQSVSQRQASLGVCVVHLDGLAVGRREDVPGAQTPAADHVLAARHDEMGLHALSVASSPVSECFTL